MYILTLKQLRTGSKSFVWTLQGSYKSLLAAVHLCLANARMECTGAYTVNCIFTLCSREIFLSLVTFLNLALIYGDITFNSLC